MSRHEGVSCDSCLKTNFQCRRYKCLICYDYDLCANCFEDKVTSSSHLADHPMQCILTRNDIQLYYGGEVLTTDAPQSFTCPLCKKIGYSESTLFEHVNAEHTENNYEVVCPLCAAVPGGDSNLITDDFACHLAVEHRPGNRDLISFLDEPSAIRHGGIRRISHSGRPINTPRGRGRINGMSVIYPVARDPTAEILFQLSAGRLGVPTSTQLQQLQTQIRMERQQFQAARQQIERQHVSAARQQLERLTRIPTVYKQLTANGQTDSSITLSVTPQLNQADGTGIESNRGTDSQYLLNRLMAKYEKDVGKLETERQAKSQYILNLLLSTISELPADEQPPSSSSSESGVATTKSNNVNNENKSKNQTKPMKVEAATNTIDLDNSKIEDELQQLFAMPRPRPVTKKSSVNQLKAASDCCLNRKTNQHQPSGIGGAVGGGGHGHGHGKSGRENRPAKVAAATGGNGSGSIDAVGIGGGSVGAGGNGSGGSTSVSFGAIKKGTSGNDAR